MRISGISSSLNPMNPYGAAAERATAAERVGTARRKPGKNVSGFEGACSPTEAFNLGYWVDHRAMPLQGDSQNEKL